jgi:hypothetical protein
MLTKKKNEGLNRWKSEALKSKSPIARALISSLFTSISDMPLGGGVIKIYTFFFEK